ncbi:hypothetical protein HDU93_006372, partial [Gonapodya sp. JEL0774]
TASAIVSTPSDASFTSQPPSSNLTLSGSLAQSETLPSWASTHSSLLGSELTSDAASSEFLSEGMTSPGGESTPSPEEAPATAGSTSLQYTKSFVLNHLPSTFLPGWNPGSPQTVAAAYRRAMDASRPVSVYSPMAGPLRKEEPMKERKPAVRFASEVAVKTFEKGQIMSGSLGVVVDAPEAGED